MNLRNWSKEHTKGLIVGLLTIGISIFIVIWIFTFIYGASYSELFRRFWYLKDYTSKIISLAAIGNLPWFHFVSLKQSKWAFGQGIIMATVIDLILMLLIKFVF